MSIMKKIGLFFLFLIVAIQFFQPARNNSGQESEQDFSRAVFVPEKVKLILKASCYDCHSNHTNYPWYASFQPMGWFLANHIKNGKAELNFNEFGKYTLRRQQSKLKSIASQVKDDEMPLTSYTLMHRNAKVTKEEKSMIIDWALNAKDNIEKK